MKERGLSTGAIVGIVVVAVVVPVIIVAVLIGSGIIGGGSRVEITFTPSTVHIGDNYTLTMTVTNRESGTMTISGGTMKTYQNDQLLDTSTTAWENSIPPGQTVTIFSISSTAPSTQYYGGTTSSSVGTWRFEVSLDTNYGTFTDSCTFTILA